MANEHLPHRILFRVWELRVLSMIFLVVTLWVFFFVPDAVLQWVASRAGLAEKSLRGIFPIIFSAGAAGIILLAFANFMIGDPLLTQNTKASLFFRNQFPSSSIAKQFNVSPEEARKIWHDYYDTWQFNTSPHYDRYLETTRTGFACRTIYITRLLFWTLFAISLILVGLECRAGMVGGNMAAEVFVTMILCGVASMLTFLHRVPSAPGGRPTGCWSLWRDRCSENFSAFQYDLKDEAAGNLQQFHDAIRKNLLQLKSTAIPPKSVISLVVKWWGL